MHIDVTVGRSGSAKGVSYFDGQLGAAAVPVGMPVMAPIDALRVNSAGKVPELIEKI